MPWNVLKLDLDSARWIPKLVSIDAHSYAVLTSQSLRATIGPLQDNWPLSATSSESQESYLTTGMLPYKHSSLFPPSHGSIMLPPRQPRVFARLANGWLVGNYGGWFSFNCNLQLYVFCLVHEIDFWLTFLKAEKNCWCFILYREACTTEWWFDLSPGTSVWKMACAIVIFYPWNWRDIDSSTRGERTQCAEHCFRNFRALFPR